MKKALVIALMMVLGLGVLASAQSFSCTGSWDVTFTFNPYKLSNLCIDYWSEIFGLDSNLTLDLTVGSWLFSSASTFNAALGFSAQEFSAVGNLGAFTLSAKMEFLPQAIKEKGQIWWTEWVLADPFVWASVAPPGSEYDYFFLYNNPGDDCDAAGDDECKVTVLTSDPSCPWFGWENLDLGPVFKDFEATGSVSIAGATLEGLFLMNAWAGTTTVIDVWLWDVCSEEAFLVPELSNLYWSHVEPIALNAILEDFDIVLAPDLYYWGTATRGGDDPIGTGFRFKIGGVAGPMTFTSFTYFSMTESDAAADTDSGCPVLGKKGDYAVAGDCVFGFTEEYFMVEGIPLCCDMSIDAALKLVCPEPKDTLTCVCEDEILKKWTWEYKEEEQVVQSGSVTAYFPSIDEDCTTTTTIVGFEYFQILVKNIPFVPGMMDLTASVKFTTDDKEFSLCGQPDFGINTCFNVTLLANWEEDEAHNSIANKLTGIDIKDFSFVCECAPGVTFTFKDVLYDLPTNALKTISSDEVLPFFVPLDADNITPAIDMAPVPVPPTAPCPPRIPYLPDGDDVGTCPDADDDAYENILVEYWDTPKYKYYAWESLSIELDGDACCGGAFAITIDNYIGKKYEAEPEFCGCICYVEDEMYYEECGDKKFLFNRDTYKCTWTKDPNYQEVGKLGSLFSWMATDVDVSVALFSNFTLTVTSEVSFRGWETFGLGFGFIW